MALRLRPRDGWESLDLGIALVRSRWRPIYPTPHRTNRTAQASNRRRKHGLLAIRRNGPVS